VLTTFITLTPVLPPTPLPAPVISVPTVPVPPGSVNTVAYILTTSGGVSGQVVQMPGGTTTITRSPLNPNHVALVDARGLLFLYTDFAGGQGGRIQGSPFSEPEPQTAETNQARVVQTVYAPNARYVAFMIDTDSDGSGDNDSSNDGIWVLPVDPQTGAPTGGAFILLRDCPPGCTIVNRPDAPYQYRSLRFEWSPQGDTLLVELDLPEEGRRGVALLNPALGEAQAQTRVPVLRYDYASWSTDGTRLVVSGRAPDGQVVIGTVNPDGGNPALTAVSSLGLGWAQDAAQLANGQILFLGGAAPSAPLRLYNASGTALTGDIGSAPPVRVRWSPDRRGVMVVTEENGIREHYLVTVSNGAIARITGDIAGALAVEWDQ
jgi:hypothetical protein